MDDERWRPMPENAPLGGRGAQRLERVIVSADFAARRSPGAQRRFGERLVAATARQLDMTEAGPARICGSAGSPASACARGAADALRSSRRSSR